MGLNNCRLWVGLNYCRQSRIGCIQAYGNILMFVTSHETPKHVSFPTLIFFTSFTISFFFTVQSPSPTPTAPINTAAEPQVRDSRDERMKRTGVKNKVNKKK